MYDGDQNRLMAQYNRWMNRKLYAVCTEIPDEQRRKDLGAFFKSIHGTLNHRLYADKAWMGATLPARVSALPGYGPNDLCRLR